MKYTKFTSASHLGTYMANTQSTKKDTYLLKQSGEFNPLTCLPFGVRFSIPYTATLLSVDKTTPL